MRIRTTAKSTLRELASRSNDGIHVTLLWNERTDDLTVAVRDARTGRAFQVGAARDRALDVFYHPFAYAG